MGVEGRIATVVARGTRGGRYCKRSPEFKREIVLECLVPGASVAAVALAHGVNANLVRKWIQKHRAGEERSAPETTLLAVKVRDEPPPTSVNGAAALPTPGRIDIELPAGRVRVHGCVDAELLRAVLASLLR